MSKNMSQRLQVEHVSEVAAPVFQRLEAKLQNQSDYEEIKTELR